MKNSPETASHWVSFIASRPEFVGGQRLLDQFNHSMLSNFCECGCQSFNAVMVQGSEEEPIAAPSERGRVVFMLEFKTVNPEGSLEFIVYADKAGNFDGMDVHFNGNTDPIPDRVQIDEPPYHVYGALAATPNPSFQRTAFGSR